MIKYLEKILEFFKPIIARGQTRFIVTIVAIFCEYLLGKYGGNNVELVRLAILTIPIIAIAFIILKTIQSQDIHK